MLTLDDIPSFLALAEAEQWLSDQWELEYLWRSFPAGCLACRANGKPVAFITALRHDRSGWIGNLIVHESWRRHGIGSALLNRALTALEAAGTETVWLTASADGKGLYERLGFIPIDSVSRWQGQGFPRTTGTNAALTEMLSIDTAGWGDRRESLLQMTCQRGATVSDRTGFLVLQPWEHGRQIGPWGATTARNASKLLLQCLDLYRDDCKLFLDVPDGNSVAATLLTDAGFKRVSSTTLMYRGISPRYAPQCIFSLASMGSMG